MPSEAQHGWRVAYVLARSRHTEGHSCVCERRQNGWVWKGRRPCFPAVWNHCVWLNSNFLIDSGVAYCTAALWQQECVHHLHTLSYIHINIKLQQMTRRHTEYSGQQSLVVMECLVTATCAFTYVHRSQRESVWHWSMTGQRWVNFTHDPDKGEMYYNLKQGFSNFLSARDPFNSKNKKVLLLLLLLIVMTTYFTYFDKQ